MFERDIRVLEAEHLSAAAGLTPPTTEPRRSRGLIVGFDTEWDASTKDLLSVQFAAVVNGERIARVYDPPRRRLTPKSLAKLVRRFALDVGLPIPESKKGRRGEVRIFLTAHFAQAEIGMFSNPFRDLKIKQVNKAHHAIMDDWRDRDGRRWILRIVDLSAFFDMALAQIGDTVDLPKIELPDGVIEHMADFKRTSPEEFAAYAKRDAEIAAVAFEHFRDKMLREWGLDPLIYKTLPGLGNAILRYHFLKVDPVPSVTKKSRDRKGRVNSARVVPSSHVPIRNLALRSYWGGRNEAYVRGLYIGPVRELDVMSLYPSAAIAQPLPHAKTRWRKITCDADLERMEGFAHFKFKFPKTCPYPCLVTPDESRPRIMFPRSGETWCTLAEIRAAVAMGATGTVYEAVGFVPGDAERNHDVTRYMRRFLKDKSEAKKGSLDYLVSKMLLNAVIGKFAERVEPDVVLGLERAGRLSGAPGLGAVVFRDHCLRDVLKGKLRLGSGWAPEWAALILGRARAIMASIVACGALHVSTDGVIFPVEVVGDVERCAGVEELRHVASRLNAECEGDAVFISRSRVYAVLKDVRKLKPDDHVLGRDDTWAVTKIARHAVPGSQKEAAEDFLACIRAGKDVAPERERTRLLKAGFAARVGRRVNDEVIERRGYLFTWDFKRHLADRDVNVFGAFSKTTPYDSLGRALTALRLAEIAGKARLRPRRRRNARKALGTIIAMRAAGKSVREIATAVRLPKSTVYDIVRRPRVLEPRSLLVRKFGDPDALSAATRP